MLEVAILFFEREWFMARHEIMHLILNEFNGNDTKSIEDLVETIANAHTDIYPSQIRSALLGLLRRNDLELTDEFQLRRADHPVAA